MVTDVVLRIRSVTHGFTKYVSASGFLCTPFSRHRSSAYIVKDMRANMPVPDRIVWLAQTEGEFGSAIVSGKSFSVERLRTGVARMIEEAEQQLKRLLLGMSVDGVADNLLGINSENTESLRTCFLDDVGNQKQLGFDKDRHSISQHLHASQQLSQFVILSRRPREGILPQRARIKEYLRSATDLQDLLLALVHLTAMPGRATEIATQRLRRDADEPPALKVVGSHLCIQTLKNKNGLWAIARFPAPAVSKLLLRYLLTVRQFEVALVDISEGKHRSVTRHLALWVSSDSKAYTGQGVANAINIAFPRWMEVPITLRDARQFYAAMAFRFLGHEEGDNPDSASGPTAAQAAQMGHSVGTHMLHYGKDAETWSKVREGKTEQWIRVSQGVQRLLNLEHVSFFRTGALFS